MKLELLAPAKNLEFGREAINHGADALYIGAPAFGARAAATNTIEDIDALVRYAHLYGAKVYVTVNTLLYDSELDDAVKMIYQLYDAGADALLIQDMGLWYCDLPPIALHASTQCHNASIERIKFMESTGFSRVVLARETSLAQMRAIHKATHLELEAFVHGALCVSYSGQCYMSQFLNGRSGNRGCCSQPCRSSYDLLNDDGRRLVKDRHLLSLRDFNASQHLASMIDAGITSFKIEGRLKDLSYVKNITAYYRRLLDGIIKGSSLSRASSGTTTFFFTPDPDRTFNRGYTDYFLRGRQPMANFATQKSMGKRVGEVTTVGRHSLTVDGTEPFANGDGLCYLDADNRLQGFLVNHVQDRTLTPNVMPDIQVGATLWRNNDQLFEKMLQGRTAERKIGVLIRFCFIPNGFSVRMEDEDGVTAFVDIEMDYVSADNPVRVSENIERQLAKLGDTPFVATDVFECTGGLYFLPASTLNQMRRAAVEALKLCRVNHFRPKDVYPAEGRYADDAVPYPETSVDYRANVVNAKAETFYRHHGVTQVERGLEQTHNYDGKALMTTKYCLRYELGCCLHPEKWKAAKDRPATDNASAAHLEAPIRPDDTLLLRNQDRLFRLEFDCSQCLMRIYKK